MAVADKMLLAIIFLWNSFLLFFAHTLSLPFSLLFYGPLLSLSVLKIQAPHYLYAPLLAGVAMDLISDDPMGAHALNYVIVASLAFQIRSFFSFENFLHFSVFTSLISLISTFLQLFLLFLFDRRIPFSGKWIFGDLLVMPVLDGVYALIGFSLFFLAYRKTIHYGSAFWLRCKERIFPTLP